MPYKIAVASSDGVQVDLHFGSAGRFTIIDVKDDGSYTLIDTRLVSTDYELVENTASCNEKSGCDSSCDNKTGGCGNGSSNSGLDSKVNIISDCRCLLCKNIGPSAARLLDRKAITPFQIDLSVEKSLEKIIDYYYKIDNHISLKSKKVMK